jgi:hypothetical protein
MRRGIREVSAIWRVAGKKPSASPSAPKLDLPDHRLEGRHRRAPEQRRAGAAQEGQGQDRPRPGRFRDGKTVEVETETGHAGHPRRNDRHRHRFGAGRTAVPALRRQCDLLDGSAGAEPRCRKLAVVGGGYIGLELGTAFAKLGSKVTVVEAHRASCRNMMPN